MIYLDALTEKTENVSDTDIMLIEDDEDTKKIQIKTLKSVLQQDSDKKIEDVKTATLEECQQLIDVLSQQNTSVMNAYYALARNYEYLNDAFEEMKEKLAEYVENQSQVMLGVPVISSISNTDGQITLQWTDAFNAEGYKIYTKDFDEDGKDLGTYTLRGETLNTTLTHTITDLTEGDYIFVVCAYLQSTSGEKLGAFSLPKEITIEPVSQEPEPEPEPEPEDPSPDVEPEQPEP